MMAALTFTALALVAGSLRAESPAVPKMSKADLQTMIRDAHTKDQYQTLATYYRSRQVSFKQQAQSEIQEWGRRLQNDTGLAAKYPRPVDSSRNRYEYFRYEADQMGQQAAHFESLSGTATQ
jgi:Skp family chaperone for outer membrane proteins